MTLALAVIKAGQRAQRGAAHETWAAPRAPEACPAPLGDVLLALVDTPVGAAATLTGHEAILDQAAPQPGGVVVELRQDRVHLFFGVALTWLEGLQHVPQQHLELLLLDRELLLEPPVP